MSSSRKGLVQEHAGCNHGCHHRARGVSHVGFLGFSSLLSFPPELPWEVSRWGPRVPGQQRGQGRWGAFEGGCRTQSSWWGSKLSSEALLGPQKSMRSLGFLLQRGEEGAARGYDISK